MIAKTEKRQDTEERSRKDRRSIVPAASRKQQNGKCQCDKQETNLQYSNDLPESISKNVMLCSLLSAWMLKKNVYA